MEPNELAQKLIEDLDAIPKRRTAPLRAVRRDYSRRIEDEPADFVLDLARAILRSGRYRWIAYELIADHSEAFHALDRETLEELGHGIDNWDTVDTFARTLSGPAWLAGLIEIDAIRDWARSDDRWWRRAALVSTVALNIRSHGGYGDTERTLAIGRMLANDDDDMVVKALSCLQYPTLCLWTKRPPGGILWFATNSSGGVRWSAAMQSPLSSPWPLRGARPSMPFSPT